MNWHTASVTTVWKCWLIDWRKQIKLFYKENLRNPSFQRRKSKEIFLCKKLLKAFLLDLFPQNDFLKQESQFASISSNRKIHFQASQAAGTSGKLQPRKNWLRVQADVLIEQGDSPESRLRTETWLPLQFKVLRTRNHAKSVLSVAEAKNWFEVFNLTQIDSEYRKQALGTCHCLW